jgi:hypothetical protein
LLAKDYRLQSLNGRVDDRVAPGGKIGHRPH